MELTYTLTHASQKKKGKKSTNDKIIFFDKKGEREKETQKKELRTEQISNRIESK